MDKSGRIKAVVVDYLGMIGALAGLIVIFGLSADHFFTVDTFTTIASQIPDITIIAVGMTFVLIIAGIDLSVGSVLALSGAVFGVCIVHLELPLVPAFAACLAVGLICGCVNGLITVLWGLPSFIVTLGMLEAARGGAYGVTSSQTIYLGNDCLGWLTGSVLFIPIPFIMFILSMSPSFPASFRNILRQD